MREPVAWMVKTKTGLIRFCWSEKPSDEQLATTGFDGDTITPLCSAAEIERKDAALNEAADKALLNATKYSDFVQAVTDPENQPSQYGTVTLDYHRAAIAELESKLAESEKLAAAISRDCNDTALERNAAKAATADLVAAGRAVVERWDSPLWKDQPHTGEYISRLRATCDKHDTKKVAP